MGRIAPIKTPDGDKYIMRVSEIFIIELRHALDEFGIIAQRRALSHIGIPVVIDRGREWWM